MAGTVRKIIERIKEQRSGGNSVVALTAETRLVLQGFDPERFDLDTPDDPGRLARIRDIAQEMGVEISDLLEQADASPDASATPAPAPGAPVSTGHSSEVAASAQAAAAAAGIETSLGGNDPAFAARSMPPSDHPLHRFKTIADEVLAELPDGGAGPQSGAAHSVLVKASLLMALYSIASDRVLLDQLQYNGLFQWFLDLGSAASYDADAFSGDRQEALGRDSSRRFFDELVPRAGRERLFSSDRLQANGRQIKGWMSAGASA